MTRRIDLEELEARVGYFRPHPHLFPKFAISNMTRSLAIDQWLDWAIDAIANYQRNPTIWRNPKLKRFQRWTVKVAEDESGTLELRSHTDEKPIYTQKFEGVYADFKSLDLRVFEVFGAPEGDHDVWTVCIWR